MKRLLPLAVTALIFVGCGPSYPKSLPETGEVWLDPGFRAQLESAHTEYASAIVAALPVLVSPACDKMKSVGLDDEPLCRETPACGGEVSEVASRIVYEPRSAVPAEARGQLLALMSASLRHSESLLVPGLDTDDWQDVLRAACEESPLVAALDDDPELEDHFTTLHGRKYDRCDLDYLNAVRASKGVWLARTSTALERTGACGDE